jgi:hypothetical protein
MSAELSKEAVMSKNQSLLRKWNAWYGVLRHRNGFGLIESVRFGLWLARSESTVR